jgi:hypothetical protein
MTRNVGYSNDETTKVEAPHQMPAVHIGLKNLKHASEERPTSRFHFGRRVREAHIAIAIDSQPQAEGWVDTLLATWRCGYSCVDPDQRNCQGGDASE